MNEILSEMIFLTSNISRDLVNWIICLIETNPTHSYFFLT